MILVVDDDRSIRLSLKLLLERNEYEVALAEGPKEAIQMVRNNPSVELVLMDMNYTHATDGEEGLTLLKQVKVFRPDVPCILMTSWGTIELAVQGMRAGAFDFITKPWNNGVLLDRIETAIKINCSSPTAQLAPTSPIVGTSLAGILATVARVAPTNAPVLITGESGTGKELIAEAIHRQSRRANGPFVKVNLGGISTSLFESEMFGHKKGSFTDAKADRVGRFELAKGGTIFLDEIGELSLTSQVKLLRVLQDQTYEVLGDSQTRRTDVRVVCATNADLQTMVEEHTFREDLFYRINLINLHLPPLRERREDIPLLVNHFIRLTSESNHLPMVTVSTDAIGYLQNLPYPGNIRELKNIVERALLMKNPETNQLGLEDFAINTMTHESTAFPSDAKSLSDMERSVIAACIAKHNGNLSLVAKELGISRGALYRKIEKYGL
ncbi:MAG: sigma-54-dependent Fis family transcriptional regulator [Bacteroidaceae bacterium]|nr:sigma-54-dependent Fis family transcriptional regulator [Bacteroidaceae bacterium]